MKLKALTVMMWMSIHTLHRGHHLPFLLLRQKRSPRISPTSWLIWWCMSSSLSTTSSPCGHHHPIWNPFPHHTQDGASRAEGGTQWRNKSFFSCSSHKHTKSINLSRPAPSILPESQQHLLLHKHWPVLPHQQIQPAINGARFTGVLWKREQTLVWRFRAWIGSTSK